MNNKWLSLKKEKMEDEKEEVVITWVLTQEQPDKIPKKGSLILPNIQLKQKEKENTVSPSRLKAQ